jgi:hypothetical protein
MPQNDLKNAATTPESSPICHLASSYYSSFFKNLKILYDDERFFDIELHCADSDGNSETNIIKAHRVILSSSSSYFEAMFGNDFNENKNKVVKFHSINYSVLKTLVNFIYTGKIEINQVNVQELLAGNYQNYFKKFNSMKFY